MLDFPKLLRYISKCVNFNLNYIHLRGLRANSHCVYMNSIFHFHESNLHLSCFLQVRLIRRLIFSPFYKCLRSERKELKKYLCGNICEPFKVINELITKVTMDYSSPNHSYDGDHVVRLCNHSFRAYSEAEMGTADLPKVIFMVKMFSEDRSIKSQV